MISWKDSLEKISKDLELAKKKKQALDDLFNSGKISASTYESLDGELTNTISAIEARQKDLADKMTSKISDLEKQVGTLEMFLANSEIQYAAGEINEELHTSEIGAFSMGLDVVRQQLSAIKEVVTSLMPEVVSPSPPLTPSETEEITTTEEVVEETPETSVETPVEEASIEETIQVEPVSEEVTVEEPSETPIEEIPTEEVIEATAEEVAEATPTEEAVETLPIPPGEETLQEGVPSEEVFQESVVTDFSDETVSEEAVTEEEVVVDKEEAAIEEESDESSEDVSSYEEEEATTQEETY